MRTCSTNTRIRSAASPRAVLKRQVERPASAFTAKATGSRFVFDNSMRTAGTTAFRDRALTRLQTEEHHISRQPKEERERALRNGPYGAGIPVRKHTRARTEAGQARGQHPLRDALETADGHVITKAAAKEIAPRPTASRSPSWPNTTT